jgi:hypothetical protein
MGRQPTLLRVSLIETTTDTGSQYMSIALQLAAHALPGHLTLTACSRLMVSNNIIL